MTPDLVNINGWFWPASDQYARPALMADVQRAVPALLRHVRQRRVIVQAGGNVGLFPLALADHFQRVFTAEPDPENYACLERNLEARDSLGRVSAACGAFGESFGEGRVVMVEPGNCGAHRIALSEGEGAFSVVPIDALLLPACDAIYLDVEGAELLCLKGASNTIDRCSPVICVEDKGHHRSFGIEDGALQDWLIARGYEQADQFGNDKVFKRNIG